MDQIELIVAAKQRTGLTSNEKLAPRLGVDSGRMSQLARGKKPADEAEIAMLADMAGIDLHIAFAAVHAAREKNPAKRDYWHKIFRDFSIAVFMGSLIFCGFPGDAKANVQEAQSINYANFRIRKRPLARCFEAMTRVIKYWLTEQLRRVNAEA